MRLILASQSPRRRELMTAAGYEFESIAPSPSAECGVCSGESPAELVARLAYQKALDVVPRVVGPAVLVACDTVAEVRGWVLGKPHDRRHAEEMLRTLSGRRHRVYSGLCVIRLPDGTPRGRVAVSELEMAPLTDDQIEHYLDSDAWVGKAGAFGYQDGHPWLRLVSGTAENVVGLPMDLLAEMLAESDLDPIGPGL